MAQEPKGTTIVVTGAGSGIGYAITRRLLEAGYAVSAWDVTEGKLAGKDVFAAYRLLLRCLSGVLAGYSPCVPDRPPW